MFQKEYDPKMFNPQEDFLDEYGEYNEHIEKSKIWNALTYGEKSRLCEYKIILEEEKLKKLDKNKEDRKKELEAWIKDKCLGVSNIPPFSG